MAATPLDPKLVEKLLEERFVDVNKELRKPFSLGIQSTIDDSPIDFDKAAKIIEDFIKYGPTLQPTQEVAKKAAALNRFGFFKEEPSRSTPQVDNQLDQQKKDKQDINQDQSKSNRRK